MNILGQEIKMAFSSFLAFTLGMLCTSYLFLFLFPSFSKSSAVLETLLENIPVSLRSALGLGQISLWELHGYLTFVITYMLLVGGIYSAKLSLGIFSQEGRLKTSDFLFSKPVTRYQIFFYKFMVIQGLLLLQTLIFTGSTLVFLYFKYPETTDFTIVLWLCISLWLVQLFFAGIGTFIATTFKRIKSVMPIALAVVFLFYIIDMIEQSIAEEKLSWFSPFSYFRGADLLTNRHWSLTFILLDISVFVVLTLLALMQYQKKNLPST